MDASIPSPRPRRRMSKGMYILPSLFTTANMAAGFYAILEVVHASGGASWHLDNASKAIGFAVLFDGLDGRVARMTGTSSDFSGRRHHVWRSSRDACLDVGISPDAAGCFDGLEHQADAARCDCEFSFFDGRCQPLGAVQHHEQSRAFQSGASGEEILCRHADSRGGRSDRRSGSFSVRRTARFLVHGDYLAGHGCGRGISDGKHMAVLQFQRH